MGAWISVSQRPDRRNRAGFVPAHPCPSAGLSRSSGHPSSRGHGSTCRPRTDRSACPCLHGGLPADGACRRGRLGRWCNHHRQRWGRRRQHDRRLPPLGGSSQSHPGPRLPAYSTIGLTGWPLGEAVDLDYLDVEAATRAVLANRDIVVGSRYGRLRLSSWASSALSRCVERWKSVGAQKCRSWFTSVEHQPRFATSSLSSALAT